MWKIILIITRIHNVKPRISLVKKIYRKLKSKRVQSLLRRYLFNIKLSQNIISENIYKGLKLLPEDIQGGHSEAGIFKTLIEWQKLYLARSFYLVR